MQEVERIVKKQGAGCRMPGNNLGWCFLGCLYD